MKQYQLIIFCIALLVLQACASSTATPSTPAIEVSQTLPQPTTLPPSQTQLPTETLVPFTPTVTFTPIAIQQLTYSQYENFTLLLPASTPLANPDTISGVIYSGYGVVDNAQVVLSTTYCGPAFAQTTSNNLGRYAFANVPAGAYFLQVDADGFPGFCGLEIRKSSGVGLSRDILRPLLGLRMISPKDRGVVTGSRPTLEWQAISDASFYTVHLTVQTSGEPGWQGNWAGQVVGTWLTNSTTFTIPVDLNATKDYKVSITSYTAERLPLRTVLEVRFHY